MNVSLRTKRSNLLLKRMTLLAVVSLFFAHHSLASPSRPFTFDNSTDPGSIDPQLVQTIEDTNVSVQLFEGLVTADPKHPGKVLPGVATRWTISPDGKTYTFSIRESAKWSDGTPVTAGDFVYSWERALDPKIAAMNAVKLYDIKNAKAYNSGKLKDPKQLGFKTLDARTLQVELEGPFPPFLELIAWPPYSPVKKDVVEKFGDQWTKPGNIVSNGPFILKEWHIQERMVLAKNPFYWDPANVHLNDVVVFTVEDQATALKRFEAGEIDFMYHPEETKIPTLRSRKDFYEGISSGLYYYPINAKHPVLKDARVRRALALAVDRKTLVDKVMRTGEEPAYGIIPPGISGYPYKKWFGENLTEARKLLTEAGYPNGEGFPTITISYNTKELHRQIAETLQQQWKKNLGINVALQNHEWKVHMSNLKNHQFDLARLGSISEFMYPTPMLEYLVTGSEKNYGEWSNPEFDRLWDASGREANPQTRMQMYAKMEEIVMQDMPWIPLYFYVSHWMMTPRVKNLHYLPNHLFTLKGVSVEE